MDFSNIPGRVAARFARSIEAGSGFTPKWLQWIEEEHQKGKEKVPNPNLHSKNFYPQVSFSTALKDKRFYDRAVTDFRKWLKNQDKGRGKDKDSKKDKDKPKIEKVVAKPSTKDLDTLITEHKEDFDRISKQMAEGVKENKDGLNPKEQAIKESGQVLGKYFQEYIAGKDKGASEAGRGIGLPGSKSDLFQRLLGVVESWGVKGHRLPGDEGEEARKQRAQGARDENLQNYARQAYEFTQAYFKNVGLEEMTLYHKVQDEGKGEVGDGVNLKTRSLSSFSLTPEAVEASGKCVEVKVPVNNVFLSLLTNSGLKHEVIVMGGEWKGRIVAVGFWKYTDSEGGEFYLTEKQEGILKSPFTGKDITSKPVEYTISELVSNL